MNKLTILILCAVMGGHAVQAAAQTAPSAKASTEKPKKKAAKKTTKQKSAAAAAAAATQTGLDEEEREPDIAASTSIEYSCELGNKVTIYTNADDNKHIGMRWKTRLMRLTRVDTTTGANRFENRRLGYVWLGIPAKGILLDSKKGQQLANECKNAEQMMPQVPAAPGMNSALLTPQT